MVLSESQKRLVAAIGVVLLCLTLGGQTIGFDYAFDDYSRLGILNEIDGLADAIQQPSWPGNLYRPVETICFYFASQIQGNSPAIYHATSVTLYCTVSLLAFLLLLRIADLKIAVVGSFLFSVHPLHSEVVANISYQSELLAGLGTLASCCIAMRIASETKALVALSMALFLSAVFAMLSKESGMHVLLLCPLCAYWSKKNGMRRLALIMGILGLAAVLVLSLRYIVLRDQFLVGETVLVHDNPLIKLSSHMRIWNALAYLGRYFHLSFIPFHVSAVSGFPKYVPARSLAESSPEMIFQVLTVVVACLGAAVGLLRRERIGFWLAWFLCAFALTSNLIFTIGTIFADRLAFVATLSSCALVAEILLKLHLRASFIALCVILAAYSLQMNAAIATWKNDATLFANEVEISPRNALAHYRHGVELFKRQQLEGSKVAFRRSLQLYPKNRLPMRFLIAAEFESGNHALAQRLAQQFLSNSPDDPIALDMLSCIERDLRRCPAVSLLRRGAFRNAPRIGDPL